MKTLWLVGLTGLCALGCGGKNLSLGDPDGGTSLSVPPPQCKTVPLTSLGVLAHSPQPSALAVVGPTLFIGTEDFGEADPAGEIVELPIGGTARVAASGDYLSGVVLANERQIIFPKGVATPTGPNGFAFGYPNVLVHDRATGNLRTLSTPTDSEHPAVGPIAQTKDGGVYWLASDGNMGPMHLVHWDGTSADPAVVTSAPGLQNLVSDGTDVYYRQINEHDLGAKYFSVHAGAEPVKLWTSDPQNLMVVEAVDDERLYLTRQGGGTMVAIPKSGGEPTTILSDSSLTAVHYIAVDDHHVYWAADDVLRRVPKNGGPIEIVARESGHWIQSVLFDECNVYWTRVNPAEVMMQSK
jgi:hypothetical protein